ncbi:MAG TPA: MATE family efflux transporter [Geminicoccaceae bacterium]
MATMVQTATRPASGWQGETRALLALAGPLVLAQLGQIAIQTTDVIMIGWLGPEQLAAASLGTVAVFVLLLFGIGVVSATSPMIAQALGRRRWLVREPRRTVRQGFFAALLVGIPVSLLLWQIEPILLVFGQDPKLVAMTEPYVQAALFAIVPALLTIGLRNFINALERPRAGMVVTFAGIVFNAVANYGLIFGAFGLPALGLLGAGIATALTNLAQLGALLGFVLLDRRLRRYRLLGRLWRADWARLLELLRIGVPIGVTLVFEVGLFGGAVYLMGLIGTAELAAHQIAIQIASVSFMVPLGISQAATVRVGLAAGRHDLRRARRAGLAALALGTAFMATMAVVMLTLPEPLIHIFIDTAEPGNRRVVELATTFLAIAALFQIFDGGQVIGAGALRGLRDTRVPMTIAGIGYWGIGFTAAVVLGFVLDQGGAGIWFGLLIGLVATAGPLLWRFFRLTRQPAAEPSGLRPRSTAAPA